MRGSQNAAVTGLSRLETRWVEENAPFGLCRLGEALDELLARYELTGYEVMEEIDPDFADGWTCQQFANAPCEMVA
jgi:hypothetical protein